MSRRDEFGADEANELTANPFLRYSYSEEMREEDAFPLRFTSEVSWLSVARYPAHRNQIYLHRGDQPGDLQEYIRIQELADGDVVMEPWRVRKSGLEKPIHSNTGHRQIAKLASEWFSGCLNSHDKCNAKVETSKNHWFPRRLIDLVGRPRLIVKAAGETPMSEYATLSHCWGKRPFLKLTAENEKTLRKGISMKLLPKSFQDAILTCRRLGIRYLWIDSLCILQEGPGSKEDWLVHAIEMQEVYRYCVLNIAIDRAQSPYDGAFCERNTDLLQAGRVVLQAAAAESPALWTVYLRSDFASQITNAPLSSRGWVVQERILSPRILHFGVDRIFWECEQMFLAENTATENGSTDLTNTRPFGLPPDLDSYTSKSQENGDRGSRRRLDQAWMGLVVYYSACQLSFPSKDKLVAFSAVPKSFLGAFNSEYVAGFFRCHLPRGLLWHRSSSSTGSRPASEYRAPSWSWASIDGDITWTLIEFLDDWKVESQRNIAEVIDASVQLTDPNNMFGAVKSGALVLKTLLIPVQGRAASRKNTGRPKIAKPFDATVEIYTEKNGGHGRLPALGCRVDGVCWTGDDILETGVDIFLIPIWEITLSHQVNGLKSIVERSQGLILQADPATLTYRRVGFYDADDKFATRLLGEGYKTRTIKLV